MNAHAEDLQIANAKIAELEALLASFAPLLHAIVRCDPGARLVAPDTFGLVAADLLETRATSRRRLLRMVELERQIIALRATDEAERGVIVGVRGAIEGAVRRAPAAGEVLPPEQRASWARERTTHDRPVPSSVELAEVEREACARQADEVLPGLGRLVRDGKLEPDEHGALVPPIAPLAAAEVSKR